MKKAIKNIYTKGLNKDLDKHIPQNEFLYDNENFRLITDEGQSSILLENVKGADIIYDNAGTQMQVPPGQKIIGHYVFDDKDIVLFATTNDSGVDDYPTESYVYLYKYDSDNKEYYPRITLYENTTNDIIATGLRLKNNISCIGRDETNYVRKVYWTDNDNPLRHMNITPDIDDSSDMLYSGTSNAHYANLRSAPKWKFDMLGILSPSNVTFVNYTTGNLDVGKVQYAVQYFNKYGSVSNYDISPKMIPIPREIGTVTDKFKGEKPGTNSHKGVAITVDVSSNIEYDYVRIIGLYYKGTSAPEIKIVEEIQLEDSMTTINVIDNGLGYINSLSLEELISIKTDRIVKTLERKDDRLFVGNIKEEYFDVDYDARAYRHDDTGKARIYDNTGSYTDIDDGNPSYNNYSDIEEEHDCINRYNDFTLDTTLYPYKYQSDGATRGGEGENIKYWFVNSSYRVDDNDSDGKTSSSIISDSFLGIRRGFQRGEIYRFGITFFNNKGQESFVKWIGDIRMPDSDDGIGFVNDPGPIDAFRLEVRFDVDNIPLNDDGSSMDYQILYVPRTNYDKTVLATGWLTETTKFVKLILSIPPEIENTRVNSFKENLQTDPYFQTDDTYKGFEFVSADLDLFNLNLENTYLQVKDSQLKYCNSYDAYRGTSTSHHLYKYIKYASSLNHSYDNNFYSIVNSLRLKTQEDFKPGIEHVIDPTSELVKYSPKQYFLDTNHKFVPISLEFCGELLGLSYDRYISTKDAQITNMISPFVLTTENSVFPTNLNNSAVYAYLRRKIIPYGGYNYTDRLNSKYIPASEKNDGWCNYGDTYVGYYDRVRSQVTRTFGDRQWLGKDYAWGSILWKGVPAVLTGDTPNDKYAQSQGHSQYVNLPVESSAILPMRHGFRINDEYSKEEARLAGDSQNRFEITEATYLNSNADKYSYITEYLNFDDMFQYNTTYSQLNTAKKYYPEPQLFEKLVNFNTRIYYSDIKFNGEIEDSWLKLKANNMQDVDSKYGEIQQLLNWKNYLFAFQNRGFCMLPINERATTSSSTGTPVVLGEGAILPKFLNYSQGSEKYGLQNGNKAIGTENGIYWFDTIEKKFLRFNGKTMELNFITGMSSWFRGNLSETTTYIMGYDNQFKEVLITFSNISGKSLVFSELINRFQGFYTVNPSRYIENPTLLSVRSDRLLYEHNIGARGMWYNITSSSIFEIIINDQTGLTKEFNNIEYASECFTEIDKVDQPLDTLDAIQAYNDYKSSTNIALKPYVPGDTLYTGGLAIPGTAPSTVKNIRRRQRLWRTTIPRVDSGDPTIDNYRMRDMYLHLKLTYNNIDGNQFIMHPITTYYTLSNLE